MDDLFNWKETEHIDYEQKEDLTILKSFGSITGDKEEKKELVFKISKYDFLKNKRHPSKMKQLWSVEEVTEYFIVGHEDQAYSNKLSISFLG